MATKGLEDQKALLKQRQDTEGPVTGKASGKIRSKRKSLEKKTYSSQQERDAAQIQALKGAEKGAKK